MEKILTPEETVARILGLPIDRVRYLVQEREMPVEEEAFSRWFIAHPDIVLEELKAQFEASLFRRVLRPEPAETPA
jgi:hypothetical protein